MIRKILLICCLFVSGWTNNILANSGTPIEQITTNITNNDVPLAITIPANPHTSSFNDDLALTYSLERTPILMGYPFIQDILTPHKKHWGQIIRLSISNPQLVGGSQNNIRGMLGVNYNFSEKNTTGFALAVTDYNSHENNNFDFLHRGEGFQISMGGHVTKKNIHLVTSHALEYSFSNQLIESQNNHWNNDVHSFSVASKILFPWENRNQYIYTHLGIQAAYRVSFISGFFSTIYATEQVDFLPAYFDSYTLAASSELRYELPKFSIKTASYLAYQSCLLKAAITKNNINSITNNMPELSRNYRNVCSPFAIGAQITIVPAIWAVESGVSLLWKKSGTTKTTGISIGISL